MLRISALLFLAVGLPGVAQGASGFPGANGEIAFVGPSGNTFQIFVMQPDTSGQTQLTSGAAENFEPSWSPDGRQIAFVGFVNGIGQVFVMNGDGTNPTQLTTDATSDDWPNWSPDGRKIVFVKDFGTQSAAIWTMNADGTSQTELTLGGQDPAWSPDGTKIAFSSSRNRIPGIFVMNADGSGVTQLAANACSGAMQEPSWSPDGNQIAFTCVMLFVDGTVHNIIVVMGRDGSTPRALTTTEEGYFGPTWSPDGTKVLFWRSDQNLFEAFPDGTGLTQVTSGTAGYAMPSWQALPSADLALAMTVASTKAKGKTTLAYTITVTNAGPSWANGVAVTDQLPAGTAFSSASSSQGSCQTPAVGAGGTLSCAVGAVAPGSTVTVLLTVGVTLKGKVSISDTATVTAATPDPNPADNTATVSAAA